MLLVRCRHAFFIGFCQDPAASAEDMYERIDELNKHLVRRAGAMSARTARGWQLNALTAASLCTGATGVTSCTCQPGLL